MRDKFLKTCTCQIYGNQNFPPQSNKSLKLGDIRFWTSGKLPKIIDLSRSTICKYFQSLFCIRCGSGTWLLELARMYPNNEYYGVDVTPLLPTDSLPGNVQFFSVNVLYDLPFEAFTFDFVHQRLLVRNFNTKQWQTIIGELARVTKPYGFIEIMEMDLSPYCQGPTTKKLFEACK